MNAAALGSSSGTAANGSSRQLVEQQQTVGSIHPKHHHQLCHWQSAYLEPSSYHWAVEKNGYPTEYEQLVSKKQYIEGVSCPVCGSQQQTVRFKGTNFREEGKCPTCGSFNRLRQIAEAALPEVQRMTGRQFGSFKELALSDLAIYNTQCAGPLHNVLQAAPGYVCSEFISSEILAGTVVRSTLHEDLQHTSFPSSTFDLILSSEVFDHIPRPYQGHHEVRRILKPGGSHVFTVPFSPDDLHDQVRASVEDGRLVHHVKPPIYAGDPLHQKGDLIFTIFGQEMVDKMCLLGFNVTAHRLHNGAHGILGNNAWVFVATKPAEPG